MSSNYLGILFVVFFHLQVFSFLCRRLPLSKTISKASMTSIATEKLGYQDFPFKSGYVAIIGNPNVGKSTTMNSILNQKLSIVSPKPQTTRHDILGILSDPNYQLVFTDTPGFIDNPQYNLQNEMNNKIREIAVNGSIFMVLSDCFGLPLNRSIIARCQIISLHFLLLYVIFF